MVIISVPNAGHGVPIQPGQGLERGGQAGGLSSWTYSNSFYGPYVIARFFGLAP